MKVKLKGAAWDGKKRYMPGDTITLDDNEAAALMRRGLCAALEEAPRAENAEGKRPGRKKDGE